MVYSTVAVKHERFDLTPRPPHPFPRCSEPWPVDPQTWYPLVSALTRPKESITDTNVNGVSHWSCRQAKAYVCTYTALTQWAFGLTYWNYSELKLLEYPQWSYYKGECGLLTKVRLMALLCYYHACTLKHTHVLVSCIDTTYVCTNIRTLKSPATAEAPPLSLQVDRPRQCAAFLTTLTRRNSNVRHLLTASVLLITLHC